MDKLHSVQAHMSNVRDSEDLQLIDLILAGDERLYARLVDRYKSYVFAITMRILGLRQEAEEAAQDTFIRAHQSLSKFNREAKFSTWLYRIAFNTAISYKRKNKRKLEDLEKAAAKVFFHEEDPVERKDKRKFLEQAMDRLTEADRMALSLFYLKEFSLEEIGEITGMLPNTAKVRIHRARLRLADELKGILKEESLSL